MESALGASEDDNEVDVDYVEMAHQVEDVAFQKSLKVEMEKARFHESIHEISELCWEKCGPSSDNRLSPKTEQCIDNCVNRFLDVSKLVTNRLSKMITKLSNEQD